LAEVIIFWVAFFPMSIPTIYMRCMGRIRLEKALVGSDEEEHE